MSPKLFYSLWVITLSQRGQGPFSLILFIFQRTLASAESASFNTETNGS
jgi:hypothetical protein